MECQDSIVQTLEGGSKLMRETVGLAFICLLYNLSPLLFNTLSLLLCLHV